jgi:hypothetical protein
MIGMAKAAKKGDGWSSTGSTPAEEKLFMEWKWQWQ